MYTAAYAIIIYNKGEEPLVWELRLIGSPNFRFSVHILIPSIRNPISLQKQTSWGLMCVSGICWSAVCGVICAASLQPASWSVYPSQPGWHLASRSIVSIKIADVDKYPY